MRMSLVFLRAVGKGVLNQLSFGIVGTSFDIAEEVWSEWRKEKRKQEHAAELQEIAQASAEEMREEIRAAVGEVAGDRSEEVQSQVEAYLLGVQPQVRHAFRRPEDQSGRTMPENTRVTNASDVARFLPPRMPRFKVGDYPPNVDYELIELLGTGGFGEVWKAKPLYGGDPVALKFCTDEATASSLRREAKLLKQVMDQDSHPGIVKLLHTYVRADPPCLAYELVEGGDLASYAASLGGHVKPEKVAKIIEQIASAVGHCHQLGEPIVHRDLKPANILVQREKTGPGRYAVRFKVADFGISDVVARQEVDRYTHRQGSRSHALSQAVSGSVHPALCLAPADDR